MDKYTGQIRCKNCGARIIIDADRKMARCEYCKDSWYLASAPGCQETNYTYAETLPTLTESRRALLGVLKAIEEKAEKQKVQAKVNLRRFLFGVPSAFFLVVAIMGLFEGTSLLMSLLIGLTISFMMGLGLHIIALLFNPDNWMIGIILGKTNDKPKD